MALSPLRIFRFPWRTREQIRREVEEELAFHLEMRAEELMARGLPPAEARRRARADFGDLDAARLALSDADVHGERERRRREGLRDLAHDVRLGVRRLLRAPAHTTAALLTLGLGIGATAAIFSVVNAVLIRPLPFPEPGRLVQIWETTPASDERNVAPANFLDWRAQSRDFESLASYAVRAGNLLGGTAPERATYATVSANFFPTFGVPPVLGRASLEAGAVVLGHDVWTTRFGADPAILGRTLSLDGESLEVVGVMPAGFDFPGEVELWTRSPDDVPPLRFLPASQPARELRDAWYFQVVGRLAPGRTLEGAQAEMDAIAARLRDTYPASNREAGVRLVPLREELVGDSRPTLLLLLSAVGLVLLMACANVAHLVLLRTAEQARELAVRAALGAGRGRLTRHLLVESLLLGLGGGLLGIALAYALVRGAGTLLPPDVLPTGEARLDATVVAFTAALSLGTALLFGSVPALAASRADLRGSLGTRGGGPGPGGARFRGALVVLEVTLAVALVSGAILTLQSLWRLQSVDPGFRPDGLTVAQVSVPASWRLGPERVAATYARIAERAAAVAGVEAAGVAMAGPTATGPGAGLRVEGVPRDEGSLPGTRWQVVSRDYFRAAGIPLLAGRVFDLRDDAAAPPVAVVNQALAQREWPGQDPLGRRVNTGLDGDADVWVTVVGVVGDTRNEGLASGPLPEMYRPLGQPVRFGPESMSLVVRSATPGAALVPALREAVWSTGAAAPLYDARSGAELLYGSTATPRFLLFLLGAFALLALVLGAVGIYGVTAYGVRQRRHEIGVRLALGATTRAVFAMVLRAGLLRVAGGLLLGLAVSLVATRALRHLLYGVAPVEPLTLAAVSVVLLAVAFASIALPARRATRVDPADALRGE